MYRELGVGVGVVVFGDGEEEGDDGQSDGGRNEGAEMERGVYRLRDMIFVAGIDEIEEG